MSGGLISQLKWTGKQYLLVLAQITGKCYRYEEQMKTHIDKDLCHSQVYNDH